MNDVIVASVGCFALSTMLEHGLASSIDATAAANLAEAARRAHPSDADVQKSASDLINKLLELLSTLSNAGVSPDRAALERVDELQRRRDFASLVREMDAFPECEELQLAGCKAIRRIMFEGGSREEAAAAGAVECVVRALDLFQHSAEMQCSSLAALNFLMPPHSEAMSVAGNAGAVRLAVRALRTFPEVNLVIGFACCALGSLSIVQQFC